MLKNINIFQLNMKETASVLLQCLSNTMAFGYCCQYISLFEIQATGVQWSNINDLPTLTGDSMTFLQVIAMMWCDTIIYLLLTWYIEAVFPGTLPALPEGCLQICKDCQCEI